EDVPFYVRQLAEIGKNAIGLTGEDLFREFCLEEREPGLQILRRISWKDEKALFGKPALCLMGPKGKRLEDLPKQLRVCVASKYPKLAKKYLNLLEDQGYAFKKTYMSGAVEESFAQGLADILIEIVYTGKSMRENNLEVYEKILESDFLVIGPTTLKEGESP
ncbi:MAG: hypothetical protein Q7S65_03025, partial [Nanoarchaeota archaeon]|nr:hypothetical protein [Nanoarchaeota archaeon]